MEHKRETDIEDYWLIQYQRLLESKPLTLLEKVCVLSYVFSNQCIIKPTLNSRLGTCQALNKFPSILVRSKWQILFWLAQVEISRNLQYFFALAFLKFLFSGII